MIAATNRVDILDPALLRSGRLDRKIEFPMPNEEARARIMQIHSRKMNVSPDVNYEELARCTDDFNGAQCKAVCVEAGMIALRRGATELNHEDYMEGILEVQAKKKANLQYYAWGHYLCLCICVWESLIIIKSCWENTCYDFWLSWVNKINKMPRVSFVISSNNLKKQCKGTWCYLETAHLEFHSSHKFILNLKQ